MARSGQRGQSDAHAFPTRQLIVLSICRICEPIAFMSIFPYVYFMIESYHMTDDHNRIALYAGLVTSVFAAAECLGAGFWGNLSDRIGRKPVLLAGLAGTGISMLMFGFAPNLPVALVARALGGALNGNIGVIQTTVHEIVTVEAHQARAFAAMPTVWCLGAFIGSALGGALADPVRNYPTVFQPGTIFEKFPYLLTNLVCTGVVVFSLLVGILFLEETHEDKKNERDKGLEIGDWLVNCFEKRGPLRHCMISSEKVAHNDETLVLIGDDLGPPDYSSTSSSPELAPAAPPVYRSPGASLEPSLDHDDLDLARDVDLEDARIPVQGDVKSRTGTANAFTTQVLLNVFGFGILAYHTISAEQLLPVLLSLPKTKTPTSLPFLFDSGFELSTKTIGGILSIQGIIQMVATFLVFPMVNRRLGNLWTYRCAVFLYPLLYVVVPYVAVLPDSLQMPAVYAVIVWKVFSQAFAFPSSSIMLANAAPSSRVLGTLNGAAAAAASGARAVGPTLSGLLQAAGLSVHALGLPWWANAAVALVGVILSLCMVENKRGVFAASNEVAAQEQLLPRSLDDTEAVAELDTAGPTRPCSPILTRLSLDVRRAANQKR